MCGGGRGAGVGGEMLISLGLRENRIGIMEYKLLFLGVLL